jgi:predicted AAA+ superfamily ATPase
LSTRTDVGALWENLIIVERIKFLRNSEKDSTHYFWRTTQQQEIDLIEEHEGNLTAYEFKWNKNAKARIPQTFLKHYKGSKAFIVSPDNFESIAISLNKSSTR